MVLDEDVVVGGDVAKVGSGKRDPGWGGKISDGGVEVVGDEEDDAVGKRRGNAPNRDGGNLPGADPVKDKKSMNQSYKNWKQ